MVEDQNEVTSIEGVIQDTQGTAIINIIIGSNPS